MNAITGKFNPGYNQSKTITIGFKPQYLAIWGTNFYDERYSDYSAICIDGTLNGIACDYEWNSSEGAEVYFANECSTVTLTSTGFKFKGSNPAVFTNSTDFAYIAIG